MKVTFDYLDEFQRGAKALRKKYPSFEEDYNTFLDVSRCPLLGIDDLGTEPLVIMDYGNEKTPIVDLLSMRYENRLFTIVTTNLTPKQIRERYGERIADRFNEMMEVVIFKNPSYRRAREA